MEGLQEGNQGWDYIPVPEMQRANETDECG